MKTVKVLGYVFLAIFLLLWGIAGLAGVTLSVAVTTVLHVLALLAGLFILIAIGHDCCCEKCVK